MATGTQSGQNKTLRCVDQIVREGFEVQIGEVSHFGQTPIRSVNTIVGLPVRRINAHYENTLPSPIRIYLWRMQWPGYLSGRFDSRK